MTKTLAILLSLAATNAAQAVEVSVSPKPIGRGPTLFGYNAAHFTPGSNTADWWRYSGVNAARVWSPPGVVEGQDDNHVWGDGVGRASQFAARRRALRADPLSAEYISWDHFDAGFNKQITAGNRMQLNHAFAQLVGIGITPLAVISRANTAYPFAEADTVNGWRDRWEHWQHFYAQAFYLARHHGVERFHVFNEPDHGSQDVSQNEYLERLQLASDAIQSAVEDANRLFGSSLIAQVQAPVSAGSVNKFDPRPGGDPRDDKKGWGQLVVENLNSWHPGIGEPTYPLITTYAYQQYNATGAAFGADLARIKRLIDRSPGSPNLKVALTEFNVHTARTFSTLEETLDTPAKAARLGSILIGLANNEPDELYVFKHGQTDNFGKQIKKNGVHYVDNATTPYNVGGSTLAGEVVRLFAKGFAGSAELLRTRSADAPTGLATLASRRAGGEVFVLSANESSESVSLSIDLSRLGLPATAAVMVEEVSATRTGQVRSFATLPPNGVVAIDQPSESVLLVSASAAPSRKLTVSALQDAMVKSGVNSDDNYGYSRNLRAKSNAANPNARNASFVKFRLGDVDPTAIDQAVLRVRGANEGTEATVTAHVYGIFADDWTEGSIVWDTAPNLAASQRGVTTIADNFVEGAGQSAFFVGHFTAAQSRDALAIDVTDFVHRHPDKTLSFLIARELRAPGENVDDAMRSLCIDSRESSDGSGPELMLAVATPPGHSSGDGVFQATGFKIGEVTSTSAIVWTRITANSERNPSDRPPVEIRYVDGKQNKGGRRGTVESVVFPPGMTAADLAEAAPGAAGQTRVRYRVEGAAEWRSTRWADVDSTRDFTKHFTIHDLQPATRYELVVEARREDGVEPLSRLDGGFRTAPVANEPAPVTFTVVTCQGNNDQDSSEGFRIFRTMLDMKPDFFVHTGDILYYDHVAKTLPIARSMWQRNWSWPLHVDFHRSTPSYFEKDDHDTWVNDCWPSMPSTYMHEFTFEQGLRVFREQVPMSEQTYRTFRWGRDLQIWLVEGRDFRSPNNAQDGPDKTIWGAEQLAWFERTVRASDATFRVLISPTPIVGPDRNKKNDNHANSGFTHEGDRLREFLASQKNMVVICGDRHWQYMSVDPRTGVREYSCGPASNAHAAGWDEEDYYPDYHRYLKVRGGFLSATVDRASGTPSLTLRFHSVNGRVRHEDVVVADQNGRAQTRR